MRPDQEVVEAHALHFVAQACGEAAAQIGHGSSCFIVRQGRAVDLANQRHARVEQSFRQGVGGRGLGRIGVLVEKLEIAAPVEDVEERLILARPEQIRA